MAAGEKQPISERVAGRPTLLAAAIAAALSSTVPLAADAAGLGRLTVQSALGQPLQAEVEVTALGREEIGSLNARLASPEAFRQAGLEYNPALSGLRFAIEQRPGGGAIVRVTSAQPVNEPFVDLLVELNWASGRFVREYTFLLDPPELRMGRDTLVAGGVGTAVAASAAPVATPAAPVRAQPVSTAPAAAPSASVAASTSSPTPAPAPAAAPAADTPNTVRVRSGDTLAKIAARVKPAHVTVDQAVMAIYQANPRAFFGTVHQLFAGADLSIPDAATMSAVDAAAARREIRAQATEFNAYRARLAASARSVEPTRAGQTAEGSVAAKADEASAPAASGDQLMLSRSGAEAGAAAGSSTGSADGEAASSAERQVAQDAALREQQERVNALERNVADLQRLVELKNAQLAELQSQVEAARAAGATASGTVGSVVSAADASASSGAADAPAVSVAADTAAPARVGEGAGTPDTSAATSGVDTSVTTSSTDISAAAASTPSTASDTATPAVTAATVDSSQPAPAVAAPTPAATPEPAATPSVLQSLMDNPLALPALVAIALGLGAYGVYAVRRRKKGAEFEDSLSSADAFTANSLFGSTGGQAVDTHASLFATSARDSGVDVHSTEVDPIAEAEVYIAYGREAQAEEILKEALKRQPERQAIRLKLLEIHAARKDPVAFGALAQEMYDQAGGLNEEWAKVVTLGLAIDPANPLYTGQGEGAAVAQPADDDGAPVATADADEVPAIADLGEEADAAAAMFGGTAKPGSDHGFPSLPGSFAETMPMDGGEATSQEAAQIDDHEVPALDFDLDLETTVGRAGSELAARDADEADVPSQDSELERAIGGRFELPSLDLGASATQEDGSPAGEPATSDEVPALADLGDFKIDLPSLEEIDSRGANPDDDELPAIDLADLGTGRPALGNLDLSSIDLELSDGDVGLAQADTAVAPQVESSRWQEMATKLDLASAYEEIGDKEGARELLQEVVDGGDASQQQKARTMLAKIG